MFTDLTPCAVGFMIMSPLFGHYVRHIRPTLLMSFGLSVWVFSAVFSGATTI